MCFKGYNLLIWDWEFDFVKKLVYRILNFWEVYFFDEESFLECKDK